MKKELKAKLKFLKRIFKICIEWGIQLTALEISIQKQIEHIKEIDEITKKIEKECENVPIPQITPENNESENELRYLKKWVLARVEELTKKMLQDTLDIIK